MNGTASYSGYFDILEVFDDDFKINFFSNNNIVQVDNASCVPCAVHGSDNKDKRSFMKTNSSQVGLVGLRKNHYCTCDMGCSCIFPIDSSKLIRIGRDKSCDLVIDHPATSFLHFVIWKVQFDPNATAITYIMDKSRNGVYINGLLLGRGNIHILRDYDIIVIKRAIKVSFRLLDDTENPSSIPYKQEVGKWVISDLLIGSGSYGDVYVANFNNNAKNFAVKIIKNMKNKKLKYSEKQQLHNESKILMKINHFNIIKVHDTIMVDNHFYIFEDLISGGDLFSYMFKDNKLCPLSESESIFIVFQLLKALDYLHNVLHIIHRDLKLENVLLSLPIPGSRIYICDFGIAKAMNSSFQRANTIVGTVEYSAPEVFYKSYQSDTKLSRSLEEESNTGYNSKCDMWSLGVMIYLIFTGISPFFSNDPNSIIQNAREGKVDLQQPCFSKISNNGKDFLKNLLQVDPKKRMSVNDCFKHNWISKNSEFLNKLYVKLQNI